MHPQSPKVAANANPHYEKLGGEPAVRRLVERFYELMDELPEAVAIRAMHPQDLGHSKEKLFMFLSGWLGGPPLYAERHGPPRLGRAHARFGVDSAARDAWMLCMTRALEEQVADVELRAQLVAAFAKVAESIVRH
ncbi:group II truncated hemoglobin [Aromatoleum petrolei]|uniref:Globin n=1 Tax=Aromatoleum petrolei TaxID=76116 RepID=A0ABX1MS69_9RHOO|nr:group II truncated hemoglobin [Aromatoleum petrolei]NMF90070.1 globin [Aromatoleum petrolei]QTQ36171.1 Oxygen-binding protein [Aromatoleum petrolei]